MVIINYFKKYPYALVIILVMLVWATINSIQAHYSTKELAKDGKFTLATIKDIKGARSGRWVQVEFEYNGRTYHPKARNESIAHSWIGEKILVKFLPRRPIECEYYDHLDVPDSLLNLPPTVWDTLPVAVEKQSQLN